jgi:hypothetical protein
MRNSCSKIFKLRLSLKMDSPSLWVVGRDIIIIEVELCTDVLSNLVVTNVGGSIPGLIAQGGTAVVIANQSLLKPD